MANRDLLSDDAIKAFLSAHPDWSQVDGPPAALSRTFPFKDYAAGIAFVVRFAFAAEKRDHHPDLHVLWGRVRIESSTHDTGGVTALDVEMAEIADRLYQAIPTD